jgi:hypothetical protein
MIVATDSRDFISQVPSLEVSPVAPTASLDLIGGLTVVARSAPSHVGERILYSIRPFAERL